MILIDRHDSPVANRAVTFLISCWLTSAQLARLAPYFPMWHGKPRADDRSVLGRIAFINRNGLRWQEAPKEYGPHKALHNPCSDGASMAGFAQMMAGLATDLSAGKLPVTASH
ncbi:transposase [Leisingera daeponensis]|uniref:transposase n=1 Tax=Leisingera daeponensis TaxID=405746 RepID=UPI0039655F18